MHVAFTTAEPEPRMAVCAGYSGTDHLASCLVLIMETLSWDGDLMGPLPAPRYGPTVVTLRNIGNYMIGGGATGNPLTTDFLASGSRHWVSGPAIPERMTYPCSVVTSERGFLVIDGNSKNVLEYQVDLSNPSSDAGWQEASSWPQLQSTHGSRPGCSKVGRRVVVAGYSSGKTEIIDLATRSIEYAGDLNTARHLFHIITITTEGIEKTFALGGRTGSNELDTVEELDTDTLTWKTATAKLLERRAWFGAVALPKSMIPGNINDSVKFFLGVFEKKSDRATP